LLVDDRGSLLKQPPGPCLYDLRFSHLFKFVCASVLVVCVVWKTLVCFYIPCFLYCLEYASSYSYRLSVVILLCLLCCCYCCCCCYVFALLCVRTITTLLMYNPAGIVFEGDPKLAIITIPLLVYHPMQILLGSLLVPTLRKWVANDGVLPTTSK